MAEKNKLETQKISKLFFSLAVPTVLAQIVNMLYNIVDRIYIGNMQDVGDLAITGLGLCFPIIMAITAIAHLFGTGGAPKASIAMGCGDNPTAEKILGNSVTALAISGVVMTIITLILAKPLLFLFGASENTIYYALDYINIYAIGNIFVLFSLGLNAFITAQGFSKISMATVLIGAILNIILDPIFIFGLKMGVKGAALATIISQAVSAIWVIKFLSGEKSILKIKKKNLYIEKRIILGTIALGLSPFIMTSTESILNICFNSSLFKYGGDHAVGTMTILSSVFSLCFMVNSGLTQAAQPIISYNFGAGRIDRVKKMITLLVTVSMIYAFLFFLSTQLFTEEFVSLFNKNVELKALAIRSMKVYTAGTILFGAQIAFQQSFVALGQATVSIFLACFRKLILLIPLIYILPNFFEDKVFAIFLAEPIADITAAIVTTLTFLFMYKKIVRKVDRN